MKNKSFDSQMTALEQLQAREGYYVKDFPTLFKLDTQFNERRKKIIGVYPCNAERQPPPRSIYDSPEFGDGNKLVTRIIVQSDTHQRYEDKERLRAAGMQEENLPAGDIYVHCGDFTMSGSLDELVKFYQYVCSLPYKEKIVIAGNHEVGLDLEYCKRDAFDKICNVSEQDSIKGIEMFTKSKDFVYLNNASYVSTQGQIHFFGSPVTPTYYDWAFMLPGDSKPMLENWQKIPNGTDVLITHGPAYMRGDKCVDGVYAGCKLLQEEIANRVHPLIHLFGHIHEAGGSLTTSRQILPNARQGEREIVHLNCASVNLRYKIAKYTSYCVDVLSM